MLHTSILPNKLFCFFFHHNKNCNKCRTSISIAKIIYYLNNSVATIEYPKYTRCNSRLQTMTFMRKNDGFFLTMLLIKIINLIVHNNYYMNELKFTSTTIPRCKIREPRGKATGLSSRNETQALDARR